MHRIPPHLRHPTAISQLLGIRTIDIGEATAVVELEVSTARHGNQQGTVHGGLLCELADAAFGTAHSTLIEEGESFATIELQTRFLRPVFDDTLRATARAVHRGRTVSHYECEITRADGKPVAIVNCSVMTLRGDAASGR